MSQQSILTSLAEGALPTEQSHSGAGAVTPQDTDDRIFFCSTTTGALHYDVGGEAAVQFAVIGAGALSAADFMTSG